MPATHLFHARSATGGSPLTASAVAQLLTQPAWRVHNSDTERDSYRHLEDYDNAADETSSATSTTTTSYHKQTKEEILNFYAFDERVANQHPLYSSTLLIVFSVMVVALLAYGCYLLYAQTCYRYASSKTTSTRRSGGGRSDGRNEKTQKLNDQEEEVDEDRITHDDDDDDHRYVERKSAETFGNRDGREKLELEMSHSSRSRLDPITAVTKTTESNGESAYTPMPNGHDHDPPAAATSVHVAQGVSV